MDDGFLAQHGSELITAVGIIVSAAVAGATGLFGLWMGQRLSDRQRAFALAALEEEAYSNFIGSVLSCTSATHQLVMLLRAGESEVDAFADILGEPSYLITEAREAMDDVQRARAVALMRASDPVREQVNSLGDALDRFTADIGELLDEDLFDRRIAAVREERISMVEVANLRLKHLRSGRGLQE